MVIALLQVGISSGEKLLKSSEQKVLIDIPLVMSDRRNGWVSPTFAPA
jgi:hypothetical protein